jgi:hypothetical protein
MQAEKFLCQGYVMYGLLLSEFLSLEEQEGDNVYHKVHLAA